MSELIRATIVEGADPSGRGRLKVCSPAVGVRWAAWAELLDAGAGGPTRLEGGDEVLIAFEQGDHGRPVILGSLPARLGGAAPSGLVAAALEVGAAAGGIADPILAPETRAGLQAVRTRMRHAPTLLREWGLHAGAGTGLVVLFRGPSGTGKTMAAGALARDLGAPLHRVDLAAVTSAYVAGTQASLAAIFREAEAHGAVLHFDEADALFGKRTEVSDSHDRYASLTTAYLLQRIEAYAGLVILESNGPAGLDPALLRRVGEVISFAMPGEAERRALWEAVLHAVPAERVGQVDVPALAAAHELSGAEIVQAVWAACTEAVDAGSTLSSGLLEEAARRRRSLRERG